MRRQRKDDVRIIINNQNHRLSPRHSRRTRFHQIIGFALLLTSVKSFSLNLGFLNVDVWHTDPFSCRLHQARRQDHYPPSRIRYNIQNNNKSHLYAANDPSNSSAKPSRGLFEILNGEVSDLILDKLNQKLGGSSSSSSNANANANTSGRAAANTNMKSSIAQSSDGLSKFHQSILATSKKRQRCVTGVYPLKITINENPTRKWLGGASSQMLVNGTSIEKSLASYERFQWLEEEERQVLHDGHTLFSIELLAEINVKKPGYVHVLPASSAGFSAKKEKEDTEMLKNKYRMNYEERRAQNGEEKADDDALRERLSRIIDSERERLWVTGFSLTKQSGEVNFVDVESGSMGKINQESSNAITWPNEVNTVPSQTRHEKKGDFYPGVDDIEDALLVSDGFLVPGRDNGGIYVVSKPGHSEERKICLTGGNGVDGLLSKLESGEIGTGSENGWFYHRSIWIDLTGDGRQSVLTARAKRPPIIKKTEETDNVDSCSPETDSQLVWLERPMPHRIDESTGTPLDRDGLVFDPFSPKHTPWKVGVLDCGPDVMFSVADMDCTDDTIEVFASQFFSKKLTMHSIRRGLKPEVVFSRILDDRCGASFSSTLANLDTGNNIQTRKVIDSGSTVPTLIQDSNFSHLLTTSHEGTSSSAKSEEFHSVVRHDSDEGCTSNVRVGEEKATAAESPIDGGSLFSYRVPAGKDGWKTDEWLRTVIATGFRVKGQLGNMINPGAPGFCYTFYPTRQGPKASNKMLSRPLIGIAGDCAETAYILRPSDSTSGEDPSSNYIMMCEIDCSATVGSIGIGYEDFCYVPQQSDYAKIYIPCYEKDKVLVFALGNGEEFSDGW